MGRERGEERRGGAGPRQLRAIDLDLACDAGARPDDDVVRRCAVDLRGSNADAAARIGTEGLEACQLGRESWFARLCGARVGDDFRRMVLAGTDQEGQDPAYPGNGVTVASSLSPLASRTRTVVGLPAPPGTTTA